jgi:hypothetical protein
MSRKMEHAAITPDSTMVSLDRFRLMAVIRLLITGYLPPSWVSLALRRRPPHPHCPRQGWGGLLHR